MSNPKMMNIHYLNGTRIGQKLARKIVSDLKDFDYIDYSLYSMVHIHAVKLDYNKQGDPVITMKTRADDDLDLHLTRSDRRTFEITIREVRG